MMSNSDQGNDKFTKAEVQSVIEFDDAIVDNEDKIINYQISE